MNNLVISNLSKKYNNFELKEISFNIPKGMIVGLVGENGAGKTTTIKALLNLIKIDSGKIKIFNKNYKQDEKYIKENIGAVLEDSFFPEDFYLKDINNIMKNIYKTWDEELFKKHVEKFRLSPNKKLKEYSSGMLMKLKIITALSHKPKLLILDEPTSGLDPVARREILEILQDFIQNEENSVLLSSHITTDLEHIADYIIFLHNGNIILNENRDELLENYAIVKTNAQDFKKIAKKDYLKYKKEKYEYDILIKDKNEFKKKYDIKIIEKPTIEEIMLIMIKGEN